MGANSQFEMIVLPSRMVRRRSVLQVHRKEKHIDIYPGEGYISGGVSCQVKGDLISYRTEKQGMEQVRLNFKKFLNLL